MVGLRSSPYAGAAFKTRHTGRQVEQATHPSVPERRLIADTLCTFRRQNQTLFTECLVKPLQLARALQSAKFDQVHCRDRCERCAWPMAGVGRAVRTGAAVRKGA